MLADLFGPVDRGIAVAIFATSTFIGPVAGPIVGGFITMSYLGWRWTEYLTAIMAFFFGTVGLLVVPETFAPTLLQQRARKIRFRTKNWAIHAKADDHEVDLKHICYAYLLRPFMMLALEPILILITLYMGFIYGFLYLCFEAYPIAFQEQRGWNPGVGQLPFLAITVGVLAGCAIIIIFTKTRFQAKLKQTGHVVPEERLIPMMVGGLLLPSGMFWFGWTSSPNITWVPQVISGGLLGAGVLLLFLQVGFPSLNFIFYNNPMTFCLGSELYHRRICHELQFGNCRQLFLPVVARGRIPYVCNCHGNFPLVQVLDIMADGKQFHTLGVDWAMTLLGCLTAILFPVPIIFYIYGKKIRSWSKFSPTL
jgi:DHA1 family multidrug resistance protein-like MFS transporter